MELVETNKSAVNPLTNQEGSADDASTPTLQKKESVGRKALTLDDAASTIQKHYRGHQARLQVYYSKAYYRSPTTAGKNFKSGLNHGAVAANVKDLGKSGAEKYANVSWFAVPIFFVFHSMTILGAFPWIFIFTSKRALAGQSTKEPRATVGAILWATGYVVNFGIILASLYATGTFDKGTHAEDEVNISYVAGYAGWAFCMWILLYLRAILDRWPETFGGMFKEDVSFDFSYVTVTSGPYNGNHGRVMQKRTSDGWFQVKLDGHMHVKAIPGATRLQ